MDIQTCESGLQHRLESIHLVSPILAADLGVQAAVVAGDTSMSVASILTQEVQFRILARVLEFLSANASSLPKKQDLLDALSKSIDLVFTAINKPLISALLKPAVKAQLLAIVGDFYDRIVTPKPVV